MPVAIELSNITKTFKTKSRTFDAVKDISFTVSQGSVFGFLGPNGAGKTTTIKMICNLVLPSSGTIHVNGLNVETERARAISSVGAVLEGSRNIYWELTAWQNLIYFGHLKGINTKHLKQRASILLELLDLTKVAYEQVGRFSRGMQQKVAIACALVSDPTIILLDEPILGLDIFSAQTIIKAIKYLSEYEQKTFLLTTHQIDLAEDLCQYVAIIDNGLLLANSSMQKLKNTYKKESLTNIFIKLTGKKQCNTLNN